MSEVKRFEGGKAPDVNQLNIRSLHNKSLEEGKGTGSGGSRREEEKAEVESLSSSRHRMQALQGQARVRNGPHNT